jgi:polyisoprenyl-teichoic acid--peptidoglycan teichoic acid transferase
MSGNEFWAKDMTTVHEKNKNWFSKLSPQRKIIYGLILLFVIAWCFFIGYSVSWAMEPDPDDWFIADSSDLGDKENTALLEIDGIRTVLLVGCDERDGYETGRSDTMMLAFINGDTNEISLLSIPRDCYVQLPGYSTKTKINHSYYYGGVNLTKDTIEYFLGIKIDDYVLVDFDGFVDLVDTLGGVDIDVDQRMINYDEGININPGPQTLNGKDALGYCRFRIGQDGTSSVSDIKRAEHQQNFILAMKDKLTSLSTLWKIPKLVTIANKYLDTTISNSDAIKLGNTLLNMDLENIKTYTISTYSMWINGVSYEIVHADLTMSILAEIIGDEYGYTPHIIDDGGQGRYTLPDDTEVSEEDEIPDLETDESQTTDDTTTDSDSGTTDGNTTEPDNGDNSDTDQNQQGDVWNIPEPE